MFGIRNLNKILSSALKALNYPHNFLFKIVSYLINRKLCRGSSHLEYFLDTGGAQLDLGFALVCHLQLATVMLGNRRLA